MRGELAKGLAMGDPGERAVCARGAWDAVIGAKGFSAKLPVCAADACPPCCHTPSRGPARPRYATMSLTMCVCARDFAGVEPSSKPQAVESLRTDLQRQSGEVEMLLKKHFLRQLVNKK